jgi:undecaprenyl phosphate-alpha-L-ara4N flippase subunit ArnF
LELNNHHRGYWLALLSIGLVSTAQLSLKLAMADLPPMLEMAVPANWLTFEPEVWVAVQHLVLGLLCYVVSVLVWVLVLTYLPLSVAYPLLSISYVIVYLVATHFASWGEEASMRRGLGILFIMVGVYLVSRTGSASAPVHSPP